MPRNSVSQNSNRNGRRKSSTKNKQPNSRVNTIKRSSSTTRSRSSSKNRSRSSSKSRRRSSSTGRSRSSSNGRRRSSSTGRSRSSSKCRRRSSSKGRSRSSSKGRSRSSSKGRSRSSSKCRSRSSSILPNTCSSRKSRKSGFVFRKSDESPYRERAPSAPLKLIYTSKGVSSADFHSDAWRTHESYSPARSPSSIVTRSRTGFNRIHSIGSNLDLFEDKNRFIDPNQPHQMVTMKRRHGAIPRAVMTRTSGMLLVFDQKLSNRLDSYKGIDEPDFSYEETEDIDKEIKWHENDSGCVIM